MERLTDSNKEIPSLKNERKWLDMYFKLKEYEDAEENGLLARLPLKMGSKVYIAREAYTVTEIRCFDDFEPEFIAENNYSDICFDDKDIGKTVFLTQEEAEGKLEEMEGENAISD